MLNSINTNIAAYSAQGNIGKASTSAAASISRLSSGNRIVKASDDVAALSIGTSLKTGVTTLRQALANTSQGTSLLQVADGALSQISDILQRQKAIATQANSGTLSDTERSYLNQEFQALKAQIDQIANSSSFSSVKLLDGSLSGSATVGTSSVDVALSVATTPTTLVSLAGGFDVGDVITINGVDITTVATGATAGTQVNAATYDVTLVDEATAQAASLATSLNASTDERLAKFYFTSSGADLQVQVRPGYTLNNQAEANLTYSIEEAATSYNRNPIDLFTINDEFDPTDTIVLNGTTFTFVASGATGNQFNVGTDAATQVANILSVLQNSASPSMTPFTFTASGTTIRAALADGATDTTFTVAAGTVAVPGDWTIVTAAADFAQTTADDDITGANSGSINLTQYDRGNIFTVGGGNAANGDKITVNGVAIEFTTATVGTAEAAGKVRVGASETETAANLAAFLNSSTDARLSNFSFDNNAGVVRAYLATGQLGGTTGLSITSSVTTGANLTGGTTTIADTYSRDGLGENRTRALGEISGSLLANGNTGTASGSAVNLSGVRNNADFIGKLGTGAFGSFTATYTAQDTVSLSIKVGDITYSAAAVDVSNTTATTITFNGNDGEGDAAGGSFSLTIRGGAVDVNSIDGQADADALAVRLNESFTGVTFAQSRDVTTFSTGTTVKVGGEEVARLDNVTLDLRSDNFSGANVQSFDISAPTGGRSDAVFTAVINGETYTSFSGIGATFDNNTAIQLQSASNPSRVLTIVTGNNDIASSASISIDVSTSEKASAVAAAFRTALGLDNAGEALTFQVGAASNDTIGVKIDSVNTSKLYGGATLDVTTLAGAQAAASVLDTAINTINQVRANVGALQSRLDFTSANLQSSIQNQDAARGTLLDTDVAAESTAYATAQVQLQAGIAVLAQANQLPQNLLKLIS